jgi:hypothetical protein
MRITQCDGQFLVAVNREEASRLLDACALVVLGVDEASDVSLPDDMASLLGELFQGLRGPSGSIEVSRKLSPDP